MQLSDNKKELRDKFALAALAGDWAAQNLADGPCMGDSDSIDVLKIRAKLYYRMADAMLQIREQ
jgi:hypothetical protein